jgi:hypothetical protein
MSKPTPVAHNGVEYPSITALGKQYNLSAASTKHRIEKGIALDAPKITPHQAGRMGRSASIWGNHNDFMFIGANRPTFN